DLATGSINGFDALLRWQDPQQGLVSPGQFIPILEDTGLILPVGEWVLQTVCAQIKEWQRQGIKPARSRSTCRRGNSSKRISMQSSRGSSGVPASIRR